MAICDADADCSQKLLRCVRAWVEGALPAFAEDAECLPDDPKQVFASMGNCVFTTSVPADAVRCCAARFNRTLRVSAAVALTSRARHPPDKAALRRRAVRFQARGIRDAS
jgi:hypothetical protein